MNEFIYLANLDNRSINLQIIKSFSMLILNVSNPQMLYYIFSNNFINQILSNDYEKYDDEFISHYVNFLKSLSSKLDTTTIQFFFHKQYNSFPLCSATLKLYNYPETMVKNTVRNILLSLFKLKYEPILDYFTSLPSVSYFPFMALAFRDLILKMNEKIILDDNNYQELHSIQDDIVIDILFFQDILSLKITKISNLLINALYYYVILPLLCGSLVSISRPKIAISTALYVLILLFDYVQDETFANSLFAVLFLNKISSKISKMTKDYPSSCKNYYSEWKDQIKASFPSYFEYICYNFSEPFVNHLVCNNTNFQGEEMMSDYKEINEIKKKIKKQFKDGFDITNTSHYQIVLQEVLKHMSKSELDIMINFHKNLSISTGVNVGLFSDDYRKHSFLIVMHKLIYKIKAEKDFLNNLNDVVNDSEGGPLKYLHLVNNEIKQNILSYLRSKDDTLIILVSILIFVCHKKNISTELQCVCGLAKADFHKNSNYDTGGVLNEIFSFEGNDNNEENIKNNRNGLIKPVDESSDVNSEDKKINDLHSFDNNILSIKDVKLNKSRSSSIYNELVDINIETNKENKDNNENFDFELLNINRTSINNKLTNDCNDKINNKSYSDIKNKEIDNLFFDFSKNNNSERNNNNFNEITDTNIISETHLKNNDNPITLDDLFFSNNTNNIKSDNEKEKSRMTINAKSLLFPEDNDNKINLRGSKLLDNYEKLPKDNILINNKFISKELSGVEQSSYDFQLIDCLLDVSKEDNKNIFS